MDIKRVILFYDLAISSFSNYQSKLVIDLRNNNSDAALDPLYSFQIPPGADISPTQNMGDYRSPPDGDERLPSLNDIRPPTVEPEHQAAVLFFVFLAYEAAENVGASKAELKALKHCAHFYAHDFAKMKYRVDIHPDSIGNCLVGIDGADWYGGSALAEIISSLVQDEATFNEVTHFVSEAQTVSLTSLPLLC